VTEERTVPERLLDATETLMRRDGPSAVSVREVLATAEVANASAVGYYFGNKAGLIDAVERRAVRRVEEGRTAGLESLLSKQVRPSAQDLVRAWIAPMVRLRGGRNGSLTAMVYTRIFEQAPEHWEANGAAEVMRLTRRYIEATRPLLPHADEADLLWRWQCVTAQSCWYVMGYLDVFAQPDAEQIERDLDRLVRAGAAALLA
jgi:AcrR family transcriptional regulator